MYQNAKIYKPTIGQRIELQRRKLRISKQTLAIMCKISVITITNYETDRSIPRKDILARLASVFQVSEQWILYGDDSTDNPEYAKLLRQNSLNKMNNALSEVHNFINRIVYKYVDSNTKLPHPGEILLKHRFEQDMTQKQLAKFLFSSVSLISHYENGARIMCLETAKAVATLFKLSISDLLLGNRIPFINKKIAEGNTEEKEIFEFLLECMKFYKTILEKYSFFIQEEQEEIM